MWQMSLKQKKTAHDTIRSLTSQCWIYQKIYTVPHRRLMMKLE